MRVWSTNLRIGQLIISPKNQNNMEHFFIEDRFYSDLDDFINDLFPEDGAVEELEDDWSIRVQESKLEPMFQLEDIADYAFDRIFDRFEERFSHESDEQDEDICQALNECFDAEKFNSLVPKLHYPTVLTTITKQDLLDYLND